MRLARPVYESMPPIYASIGALGLVIAYLDPEGLRTVVAFCIGMLMEVAALTVFLRRQDYRAKSREYAGTLVDLASLGLPRR
jgi:membrane protein CcdC involved in cytochrome C biogenesis